jgi:hypothetical protein
MQVLPQEFTQPYLRACTQIYPQARRNYVVCFCCTYSHHAFNAKSGAHIFASIDRDFVVENFKQFEEKFYASIARSIAASKIDNLTSVLLQY